MQAVIELALEAPLKLRMIEVSRMQLKVISMHRDGGILELDDDLDAICFRPGVKIQQRMFVQAQLCEDALQTNIGRVGHELILTEYQMKPQRAQRLPLEQSSGTSANCSQFFTIRYPHPQPRV